MDAPAPSSALPLRQRLGTLTVVVRQRQRIARVPFPQLSLIQIHAGEKRITGLPGPATRGMPGDLLIVPPGHVATVHNIPIAGRYHAHFLQIDAELVHTHACRIHPADSPPGRVTRLATQPTHVTESFMHVCRGVEEAARIPESVLVARVAELIAALEAEGVPLLAMCRPSVAAQVRKLLASNLTRPYTASALAKVLKMSPATLRRRLAEEGCSYRDVLEDLRLASALALVQEDVLPIGIIADRCGYLSSSRFTEKFRRRFGTTPSALRSKR